MKAKGLIVMIGMAIAVGAGSRSNAAPASSGVYHIVGPQHPLAAGETLQLTLVPPAPPGTRIDWQAGEAPPLRTPLGRGGQWAIHPAPFVIAPGAGPVLVTAYVSGPGLSTRATTSIELQPGAVPGINDCLGVGQTSSTVVAGATGVNVDELPDLLREVSPVVPQSVLARGTAATLRVNAFVCRDGHVLAAYVLPPRSEDGTARDADPKLEEAAVAAVKQYLFKPAMGGGQPIAIWVSVPVDIRP